MTNSLGTIARVLDISRQEEHKTPVLHYTCTNDLFLLISDLRNMILKYTPLWNKRRIRNAAKNVLIG